MKSLGTDPSMGQTGPRKCHNFKLPGPLRRSESEKKAMPKQPKGVVSKLPKDLVGAPVAEVCETIVTFVADKKKCP